MKPIIAFNQSDQRDGICSLHAIHMVSRPAASMLRTEGTFLSTAETMLRKAKHLMESLAIVEK